jgi:hypothetical protein
MTADEIYKAYRDAYTTFYSPWRVVKNTVNFAGGRGLNFEARDSMTREFLYWSYSYRRGRHPMLGGLWKLYDPQTKRQVISDAEARGRYLPDWQGKGSHSVAANVPILTLA